MKHSLNILLLSLACTVYVALATDDIPNMNIPGGLFLIENPETWTQIEEDMKPLLKKLSDKEGIELEYIRYKSGKYQVTTGIQYTFEAKMKVDKVEKDCTVVLHKVPWTGRELCSVECKDTPKYEWLVEGRAKRQGFGGFGAPSPLSEDRYPEIAGHMSTAFVKLGADKENTNFELVRILEATSQVVAGTAYKGKGEFKKNKGETKVCDFDIWEKSWEQFLKLTLNCLDGERHEVTKEKK